MTFGLMTVVLMGLVGGAVDFARHGRVNTAYRDAADAAVLAGARVKQTGGTNDEAISVANSIMERTKQKHGLVGSTTFSVIDGSTAIEAKVDHEMATAFLGVIGMDKLPVKVTNRARFGQASDLEISLMLDVTGSMSGQKLQDLKDAVEDLTNIVISEKASENKARIALAPFSNTVKLTSKQFSEATGINGGGYSRCVVERPGSETYTDANPASGGYVAPIESVAAVAGCEDGREVFPLTNKKSDLKKMVKSLQAGGYTAGHLGTAWAWYLLSPNWASLFEVDEKPAPYAELKQKNASGAPKLRKIAVLMTDGEYNTQYIGADSNTQAQAICAEMKKTGIEVFTIGFGVSGSPTVVATLKGCANSESHFYDATTGDALKNAFRDIALKASTVRLTQ